MKLFKKYADLSCVPLHRLMQYFETGYTGYLHPLYFPTPEKYANDMICEYMKEMGDTMFLSYKKRQDDLIQLRQEFSMVRSAMIIRSHKKGSEVANQILKKYRVRPEQKDIENKLRKLMVMIEIKEKEFQNVSKNTAKTEKKEFVKETIKLLTSLSKWQGQWLDIKKITALQFATLLKNYNKEAQRHERQDK